MRIGELSQRTQVSIKALRYYEEIGVLDPPERSEGGYRDYPDTAVDQVSFVRASQSVGLSLSEIKEIMVYREGGVAPCQHVLSLLRRRSDEYQDKIDELIQARTTIVRLIDRAVGLKAQDCLADNVCHLIPSDVPAVISTLAKDRSTSLRRSAWRAQSGSPVSTEGRAPATGS